MKSKELQKTIKQKFENCSSATLIVAPFDLLGGVGIFYKLNIKKAIIRCDETNKIIHKKYWNEETKNTVQALKDELQITKGGWYLMGVVLLIGLFSGVYGIYKGTVETKAYKLNYISKTRVEKQKLRAALQKDDLFRTIDAVYKIVSVEDKIIQVCKSKVTPVAHVNKPIDATKYDFSPTQITINKQSFVEHGMFNTDLKSELGGDAVFQILNK